MDSDVSRKKTTSEMLKLIINSVSEGEKSILEIAKDMDSNWETVKTYLETLKDANVLEEREDGKKRVFFIKNRKSNKTYFGLPLDSEKEKLINGLFFKINEIWKKTTSKPITQIQAQKILFKLNKSFNLGIPMGKYIYGEIAVKSFSDFEGFGNVEIGKDIILELANIVKEVSKDDYAYKTKNKHYEEINDPTYFVKEYILSRLYSPYLNKNAIHDIQLKLSTIFLNEWHKITDNKTKEILQDYNLLLQDISTNYSEELLIKNKRNFILSFENVWKLLAMFIFKNDLRKFYSEGVLETCFMYDIENQKKEVIEIGKQLQSIMPIEKEPNDEFYQELKRIKTLSNKPTKSIEGLSQDELLKLIS